jgi:hypothetical protein
MYQVGELMNFKDDDLIVNNYQGAILFALKEDKRRSTKWNNVPIGVWTDQENGSVLMAIVYEGQVFTK